MVFKLNEIQKKAAFNATKTVLLCLLIGGVLPYLVFYLPVWFTIFSLLGAAMVWLAYITYTIEFDRLTRLEKLNDYENQKTK